MEERKEANEPDFNVEYDILNDAINTFKKNLSQSILSPNYNLVKNSIFSKLKFCDLILIDNCSNFLDLKIKLEINPNKNIKAKSFLNDNLVQFLNISDLTNKLLVKLNKNSNAYTISYFKESLEKITSDIDFNNYQGNSIFVKICEKTNKKYNHLSVTTTNFLQNKNNIRNSPSNKNANDIKNESKENKNRNSKLNNNSNNLINIEKDVPIGISDKDGINIKNSFDRNNINQSLKFKQIKKPEEKLKLNNIIEETLNYNLSIKKRNLIKSSDKNSINEQNKNKTSVKSLIKIDIKNNNLNDHKPNSDLNYAIAEKEIFNPLQNLVEDKKEVSVPQYNNRFKKSKLLNDEILFKNRKHIKEKGDCKDPNKSSSRQGGINDSTGKKSVIKITNTYKKDYLSSKSNSFYKKTESKDKINSTENENSYNKDKLSPNEIDIIFSSEKNIKNKKDSLLKKYLSNYEKKFYHSERKSMGSIKIKKRIENVKNSKEIISNSIILKPNNQINDDNQFSTPYLLTNQSFFDKIKPKSEVDVITKKNFNSSNYNNQQISNLTANNFFKSNKNNSNLFGLNNSKIKGKENSPDYRGNYHEEEFFNRKIKFPKDKSMKKLNMILDNYTINQEIAKSNRKLLDNQLIPNRANLTFFNTNNKTSYLSNSNQYFNSSNYRAKFGNASNDKIMEFPSNNTFTNLFYVTNSTKNSNIRVNDKKYYPYNTAKNFIYVKDNNNVNNPNFSNTFYRSKNRDNNLANNNPNNYNDKISNFYKTFSSLSNKNFTQKYKNSINNKIKFSSNNFNNGHSINNNNESFIPSLSNKSNKNITYNNTKSLIDKELTTIIRKEERIPKEKLEKIKKFLDMHESQIGLEKTFVKYLEKIEKNESNNNMNEKGSLNVNKTDKSNNRKNTNMNPTTEISNFSNFNKNKSSINNKVTSRQDINIFNSLDNNLLNESGNSKEFLGKNSILNKKIEISPKEKLTKNFNKSAGRYQNLYSNRGKSDGSYIKSKFIPTIDKKTIEIINNTKKNIQHFINNNLPLIISNNFIEDNLKAMIFNSNIKLKDLKSNMENDKNILMLLWNTTSSKKR